MNVRQKSDPHWTLTEVARLLREPQHRLIYFCEQGIVVPASQVGSGRGSSRRFSSRNVFELALAVRMRDAHLPAQVAPLVLHVLNGLAKNLARRISGFSIPESFADKAAPDLRVIVSDGQKLFFTFVWKGEKPKLYGGVKIEAAEQGTQAIDISSFRAGKVFAASRKFGHPEGSEFSRTEISITEIAKTLAAKLK